MTRRSPCAAALAVLLAAPLAAQTPTAVGVHAEITAERYRNAFGEGTAAVESALATMFATLLREHIGFVRFEPGADTPHRLVFVLDRRDRTSTGTFVEYGFWARLEHPDAEVPEFYWLPVRPAELAFQGVGTTEDFLDAVSAKLRDPDLPAVRDRLLSRVPIATEALPWAQPAGWALPLRRDALCMRPFSEIMVVNAVMEGEISVDRADTARVISDPFTVTSSDPRVEAFQRKLFGTPISEEARRRLVAAVAAGGMRIKEIYVVKYEHDPNACERPVPPSTGGGP